MYQSISRRYVYELDRSVANPPFVSKYITIYSDDLGIGL